MHFTYNTLQNDWLCRSWSGCFSLFFWCVYMCMGVGVGACAEAEEGVRCTCVCVFTCVHVYQTFCSFLMKIIEILYFNMREFELH